MGKEKPEKIGSWLFAIVLLVIAFLSVLSINGAGKPTPSAFDSKNPESLAANSESTAVAGASPANCHSDADCPGPTAYCKFCSNQIPLCTAGGCKTDSDCIIGNKAVGKNRICCTYLEDSCTMRKCAFADDCYGLAQ